MTLPPPVAYSAELETISPNEVEIVSKLNETFDTILETTANNSGHAIRAVHAKAHAVLEGLLSIDADLTPDLAQGLFARPGEHKVYLRISTNAGDILPDTVSLPRGIAIKVLDVAGARLEGAEGSGQDFVMVNGPVFQTKTAEEFLANLKLLAGTTDRAEGAKEALSTVLRGLTKVLGAVGIESPKLQSLGGAPNVHPLGETYYSVTPFLYGRNVAKFSLHPMSPDLTALTGRVIDASDDPNAVRHAIEADMPTTDAVWEFRVQFCRDLGRQSVEDPTVKWDEADAPFQRVGTIRVQGGDSWDARRVQAVDEEMRFSVWTGLAAHRPLGNVNRSRRETYQHSAAFRQRFNGCPIHEPA